MAILVVGGDSVSAITERAYTGGHGCVEHWSGRKTRDLTRSIPKDTKAVVLVLDRGDHTSARKVRTEAAPRPSRLFPETGASSPGGRRPAARSDALARQKRVRPPGDKPVHRGTGIIRPVPIMMVGAMNLNEQNGEERATHMTSFHTPIISALHGFYPHMGASHPC